MQRLVRFLAASVGIAVGTAGSSGASEVLVSSDIAVSTTWTANNTYNLQDQIYVLPGATLTIEAGTLVASTTGLGGSLAVARGAQIFVNGTRLKPVIMTSTADVATWTGGDPKTGVWREATSEWGNLALLGSAYVSENGVVGNLPTCDPDNRGVMEGLVEPLLNEYGGGDDQDDSGSIRYLSLRYGGTVIGLGNELNGLSLGGVGRETDLSHVEVMNNVDDGVELFGGTVNLKFVSVWNVGDDSIDIDQGWRGKAQFLLIVQGHCANAPQGSGVGDNCFETDGAENSDWQPVTTATIYNATVIGQPSGGDHGTAWRDNARVQYRNCIFMDLGERLVSFDNVDGDGGSGYGHNGTLSWPSTWTTAFSVTSPVNACASPSAVYAAQSSGNLAEITDSVLFRNLHPSAYTEATARGVLAVSTNNMLIPGSDPLDAPIQSIVRGPPIIRGGQTILPVLLLDPLPANEAIFSVAAAPDDGFFTPALCRGAFAPGQNWLRGWSALEAFGALPPEAPGPDCFVAADLGSFSGPGGPFVAASPSLPAGVASSAVSGAEAAPNDPTSRELVGLAYAPPEATGNGRRPLPAQRLSIFYPQGTPPVDGWPVLLYSPCGAFREANVTTEGPLPFPLGSVSFTFGESYPLTEICNVATESSNPAVNGLFYRALLEGWAVVAVGTVGIDSKYEANGSLKPFGGHLPPHRDPNLFYAYADAQGMPSAEWLDFELSWGEKDFAWARQFVAENAPGLALDNDLVVATGISCGSVYAASIALGPDRAHASGSSQAMQSTQCAGFLGFETPAWWPAFNGEVPGSHWEGPFANRRATTIADAAAADLVASSVSTWIREPGSLAAVTPALIVYDEGVAASASADFEREDELGACGTWPAASGDPCLSAALLPCVDCLDLWDICVSLGLPENCFCNPFASRFCQGSTTHIIDYTRAHDSWNGVVLFQDLLTYGHPDSAFLIETGILAAHPGLPPQQTAIFTNTAGTFLPTASDDPLVQELTLRWLCALRDAVQGTSSSCPGADYRNVAPNIPSLSVTSPVLGGVLACVVDLTTTGHPLARVIALDTPATIPLGTYNLLCVDGGSGILFEEEGAGPIAVIEVPLASGTFPLGFTFCIQAIHFGSGDSALSNAQDVKVGL